MNRRSRWMSWLLSLILTVTYLLPINGTIVFANTVSKSTADLSIYKITQDTESIQPNETFSLSFEVLVGGIQLEAPDEVLYITDVLVTGSSIDTKNMHFTVEGDERLAWKDSAGNTENVASRKVTVSGLKYTGGSKDLTVAVECGAEYDAQTPVATSESKSFTLKAKTNEDMAGSLVVEKQENLVVKNNETQNVDVKLTNKSKQDINVAEVELSLNEKVKDLEIKTDSVTIKNIKSKETKKASFSIKVGEEVKAGIYPATVTVNGSETFSVNIQVDSNIVPSVLEVGTSVETTYTPGTPQKATFTVSNVGDRDAKNVRFEVVNSEDISIVGGSNVKYLDKVLSQSKQEIVMNLKVASTVKTESVPVQIKLTYLSSLGEEKEEVQYVYLSTSTKANVASEVVISQIESPSGVYGVDENFTVRFTVSSPKGAKDLTVYVNGEEGLANKSQNRFAINELKAGEKKEYSVTFAAKGTAESRSHYIEVNVKSNKEEDGVNISQYGSVTISNPEKDKEEDGDKIKGVPKVIVGEYSVDPRVVKAGENFELSIDFLNTHKTKSIHNLKVNLTVATDGKEETAGNVFTPVDASNTFYISDLMPQASETKTVTMYTIPSANPKTYEITLNLEYEDEDGEAIEATEIIGIHVEQVTEVELGEISVGYGEVGMNTDFSAIIYNTGKTNVSNLMMYIEGEGFTVEDNKYYIGTLASGETEEYNPSIIPQEAGTLVGQLVIEYEDTSGTQQRQVEEFTLEVEEPMVMEDFPEGDMEMPVEEQKESNKLPIIVGIGLGVIIAIIVTVVILKKSKAKKEEMMFNEEN